MNGELNLTDEFAEKILDYHSDAAAHASEQTTEDALSRIEVGATRRDAQMVADAYKDLRERLHQGAEDENVNGINMVNGTKKRKFSDLMTQCNVVYGYVYPEDDLGTRNVPRDYVLQ